MAEKIVVSTTIKLPEGYVPTEAEIASIQKIIDQGGIVPPDPEKGKCDAGPKPLRVTVKSDSLLSVDWHGVKVTPVDWLVEELSGTDLSKGQIEPKGATIELKLTAPLSKLTPQYKVVLTGVECTGEGALVFDNPFYEKPSVENPCKGGPTPLNAKMVSEKGIDVEWWGDGVTPLDWQVTGSDSNLLGKGQLTPKASDRGHVLLDLTEIPKPGDNITVVLTGVKCEGGGALTFQVPSLSDNVKIDSIEVTQKA